MKRMKKVDIIARAEQLEDLKEALNLSLIHIWYIAKGA